ncbi:MAG: hypothetical protein ACUZ8E_17610 [Candidatus Anammoxibacter sp.]
MNNINVYIETQKNINSTLTWCCANRFKFNEYYGLQKDIFDSTGRNDIYREYLLLSIFGLGAPGLLSALTGGYEWNIKTIGILNPARGLPEDVTYSIKKEYKLWGGDAHSHSWCTLQELYDYQDKNSLVTYSGFVLRQDARKMDQTGEQPSGWFKEKMGWFSGMVYREAPVKKDVMSGLVNAIEKRSCEEHWICIENDERIKRDYAERTRIVFWFDS